MNFTTVLLLVLGFLPQELARVVSLKGDTDGDGLSDSLEYFKYHTLRLKTDTDGGGIDDGTEVRRGSNPLDPSDDTNWSPKPTKEELKAEVVPVKEELKVEVGKAIVLEGIVFATGKAEITPESEINLEKAYNTLAQNSEIVVEIQGHTDATGGRTTNVSLSQARAEAVKAWLEKRGIAPGRIAARGFGPDKPTSDNITAEGRQKNRRIEFFRAK